MMKKLTALTAFLALALTLAQAAYAEITPDDYATVLKTVKTLDKLNKKGDIGNIANYYSDNYWSFDKYGKDELLQIFVISGQIYPNAKSKERITKVETQNNLIKVFVEEKTTAKLDASGVDARYAVGNKIKGRMNSSSNFALVFKKEDDGVWRIISDEIFAERTDIKYGEAIYTPFEIETPEFIKKGEEYTVKTTLEMPGDRVVVGSIGHDKIVFPPEKYPDPFRAIGSNGVLERVMIANKDGRNEYTNSTYAFIVPVKLTDKKSNKEITKPAISGMGLVVKRVNVSSETL